MPLSPSETAPDREDVAANASSAGLPMEESGRAVDLLSYARHAASEAQTYAQQNLRTAWERSYKAFRNEHFAGSKYLSSLYKSRSKVFRPKTRSAVRKQMATAAAALFSTEDVVSITPERDDDPRQRAGAAVLHEDLNYRLDRTSPKGGIPWFLISMGAVQDATITGICVSKQYWEFEEKVVGQRPVMMEVLDEETGETIFEEGTEPVTKVVRDRPMISLIPPENVLCDPAAPWYDPAQLGAYWIVRYPMHVGDLKAMIAKQSGAGKGDAVWLDVPDSLIKQAISDYDTAAVRRAREGGDDRYDPKGSAPDLGILWVHENFMRYGGTDYHFWSLGTSAYLSQVQETEQAYPALKGARPYVMGLGALEPHRVFPMAAVESWQQLQQEANDLVNLRLDAVKQSIQPITKVRRGKQVDLDQVQRRGPGATIMLQNHDDVVFEPLPNRADQAYPEMASLNADFDDLAGLFSGGSVQTNRELNETVGGMRLLSGAANAVTEFDLRVWVETWTEPVLRHLVHLIQFYESDATILAIAGEKAKLFERYGINEITDEMLTTEVGVRVNVGIGAVDPMQRMGKLQMAMGALKEMTPFFQGKVKPNVEEIVSEVMGAAGYKDGKRFFTFEEGGDGGQSPEEADAMLKAKTEQEKIASNERIAAGEAQIELAKTRINAEASIARENVRRQGEIEREMMRMREARLARIGQIFGAQQSIGLV